MLAISDTPASRRRDKEPTTDMVPRPVQSPQFDQDRLRLFLRLCLSVTMQRSKLRYMKHRHSTPFVTRDANALRRAEPARLKRLGKATLS